MFESDQEITMHLRRNPYNGVRLAKKSLFVRPSVLDTKVQRKKTEISI